MDSVRSLTQWLMVVTWAVAAICYIYRLIFSRKKSALSPASSPREKTTDGLPTSQTNPDWTILDFSSTKPIAPNFDWRNVDEKPYRPWHNGPHHVTMGLKKTQLDDWVEIDKSYLSRYRYKRKLFAEHPQDTLQHLPGSDEASFEALNYLVDFLPRRYPTMFRRTPDGIENLVTEDTWDLRRTSAVWKTWHPLQIMGLLTTEDWFIMQTSDDGETTCLRAGANCFPAGWKLRERIGLSLWQIHAGKVPMYEQNLSKAMDRFFLRLRADKPFMRFNYAVDISPELFHINSHHNLTAEALEKPLTIDQLHLRVERQYLQRLPKSRSIAFSIRTYITPITEVTKDKDVALALQTSVDSYSPEVSTYKNKPLWNGVLADHLREVLQNNDSSTRSR